MVTFLVVFLVLVAISMPISIALGLSALYFMATETDLSLMAAVQRMFSGVDSFPLMAIPFYIIAGGLMDSGGVTQRLITFANILVGFVRGGLAAASIVGNMIMAGISGSSVADCTALGTILIPSMKKEGYAPDYAAAVNATASTIGIIIPPSIPMVLLGAVASISVRDLFIGGAIPGMLVGLSMIIMSVYISTKRGYPKHEMVGFGEAVKVAWNCLPAILMPVIIIAGIVSGFVTPTEAGVVAVVYSIFVGLFIYKELTVGKFFRVLKECGVQMSVVLLVIATASIVSWLLSYLMIPQQFAHWAAETFPSKTAILFLIAVTCLFTGTIIDVTPAIILLGAVFGPVAAKVGLDPVHFGVVLVFSMAVGLFTPPVGTTLILSCYIAKTKVVTSFNACMPFLFCLLFILTLIIIFPQLVTFLPNLLFK
jgi:tripartite ATP-independent transporter DctM subunit